MIYFIMGLSIYLAIGFGFALSAWLDAQEKRVKKKLPVEVGIKTWVLFTLAWWIIAIYCYRADIKRTIPTYHYFMKDDKDD